MKISPTGSGSINIGSKIIKVSQQKEIDHNRNKGVIDYVDERRRGNEEGSREQGEIDHKRNSDLINDITEGNQFGPPEGSAYPHSPHNPGNLRALSGCDVSLRGQALDISNDTDSISINLTPEQIKQLVYELK